MAHPSVDTSGKPALSFDPEEELVFDGPPFRPSELLLTVKNNGAHPVAFKIDCSSKNRVAFFPATGVIKPYANGTVLIILFPNVTNEDIRNLAIELSSFKLQESQVRMDKEWKDIDSSEIFMWTFKCRFDNQSFDVNRVPGFRPALPCPSAIDPNHHLFAKKFLIVAKLKRENTKVKEQVKRLQEQINLKTAAYFQSPTSSRPQPAMAPNVNSRPRSRSLRSLLKRNVGLLVRVTLVFFLVNGLLEGLSKFA